MNEQTTDKLRFSVLASGSSGNCTYVETDKQRVLIDAGLSGKKIQGLMEQINRDLTQVDALFVTHEHKDHIMGVGVLARKYNLPVYANRMTWLAMENHIGAIPPENRRYIEPDQLLTLKDLDILSYNVSHDAAQPQFYAFQKGDKQFVMLTDTGYVSDRLRSQLKNATAYLIESNHEVEMLRYGQYPWSLKQRILGDKGHLSNESGALAMVDMIGDQTKQVYLGHLSRDNNTKELAMSTMHSTLSNKDMAVGQAFHLNMTDPAVATPMMYL
ncbi:MBL fold metallo-hydrolase [Tuanshanicoccus lijuaniae]|uniref:MBL fold metallo-hydrolase n=1 Tax=Aerococcaceae bacterium zg-1292 TaxID=2774330 RepID=UPI001936B468|nr:MBL fold metallo-hydrolase [Aerococcaceae bacterium zg-1292]MBF6626832.1 MBL fold metallo-hydrolase [Aerococcaceae bacterium zg-BR9]MBF6978774.1 MBL fold metallo-hydrolase [Aerococcaceae bacterium zg-BR22]MBS4456777.1 MBL fold metallo-hydrolase [Aerococcaceae bacterium zg-A91]MBS4458569.1 MBL fold metallo-hydrolase [Aerococcaceae bacterium zg-BR33]